MGPPRASLFQPGTISKLALTALALLGLASLRVGPPPAFRQSSHKHPTARVYGNVPLAFEPNEGQAETGVKFLARGPGYSLSLAEDQALLALHSASGPHLLGVKLVGANTAAKLTGEEKLPGKSNYFIGNDPLKWRTNVPNYARVRYQHVYPGVDVVYYGNQQQLEYDFVVAPGADPNSIHLAFEGADKLDLDPAGNLIVQAGGSELRMRKPHVYQEWHGGRQQITGGYLLAGKHSVSFEVGPYDRSTALVIDPTLVYSGVLNAANARVIAVDASGNAYVTGDAAYVFWRDPYGGFPTTAGVLASSGSGLFVTKLNKSGSALVYSTFISSSTTKSSTGYGIAVDDAGNAYVAGQAGSGFPTTPGAFQPSLPPGESAAVVLKLNESGSRLVYSTYLGTKSAALSIALDSSGRAYVAGYTTSPTFPAASPIQPSFVGGQCSPTPNICPDAFALRLTADGSGLSYSTFLGGPASDVAYGIAVDAAGNAYVAGGAGPGFPTTRGAFQEVQPQGGAFVTKIDSSGSFLVYSTYLGQTRANEVYQQFRTRAAGVAVDPAGNAVVVGVTNSSDFPTRNAHQDKLSPGTCGLYDLTACPDAFLAKLNAAGSDLVYSTFFGGNYQEYGTGIAVDQAGNAYIVGITSSDSTRKFPIVNALQPEAGTPSSSYPGSGGQYFNPFVAKFSSAGALVFSSYLAGSSSGSDNGQGYSLGQPDWFNGVAVDGASDIYLCGYVKSYDFPVTQGVFASRFTVGGLVAKISLAANPAPTLGSLSPTSITASTKGLDLKVVGSNFFAGSIVRWNGVPRPTKVINLYNLVATISANDLSVGGTVSVDVYNPPPGGGVSQALPFTVNVNAQPTISALQPSGTLAGAAGFLLNVVGADFVSNAIVRWNGNDRPTTFVSKTQLTVFVPATDVAVAGTAQVAVFNPPPGGGVSNSIPFTISVPQPPAINAGGVVNGASFSGSVAAGSIASVFGTGLAPAAQTADKLPLPTTLGGISVSVNGFAAPLFYVSPLQINFQVPWEASVVARPVSTVTVTVNGVTSAPQAFNLAGVAPGLFAINAAGQGAVLISATGELAAPTGSISGRAARPAKRGEYISIYCTGLGAVSNQPANGAAPASSPSSITPTAPTVTIGGMPAPVTFSGLAPSFVGLYQVNVQVPDSAAPGSAVPVVLTISGATSNTVTIAVQ